MPRGRKRKDPADAPVDADYTLDQVTNPRKGFRYLGVSEEDLPKMKMRGALRVERTPDGPRPTWDNGVDSDPDYRLGANRLLFMEISEERARAAEAGPLRIAAERLGQVKLKTAQPGGGVAIAGDGSGINQQTEA